MVHIYQQKDKNEFTLHFEKNSGWLRFVGTLWSESIKTLYIFLMLQTAGMTILAYSNPVCGEEG